MRIVLSSPVRKRAFLIGCAASLSLAWLLCWQSLAEHWLETPVSIERQSRASRIQPLNAEHQEQIGLLYMDATLGDFEQAKVHLERAAAVNPHSSRTWLNLANVYSVLGDDQRRYDAVRQALTKEPKDTQVQWEAANLFITNDLDRSLQLLRDVVENDPQYALPAMQVAYRASNNNIDQAMLAVPMITTSRLQLLNWLLERKEFDAADRVWPTVVAAPGPFIARDSFPYFDSLIARRQVETAANIWSSVVQKDATLRSRVQPDNLVMNGDFEADILNGGLSWRYVPTSGVTATLDTSTFHGGTRSLALQIDGQDLQDFSVHQLVAVQAGANYRLSAWLHAEELEAARGVRLVVSDHYSHAQLLLTDEVIGSFPWRQIAGDFTVPADTQLLDVYLTRSPANGVIRGRLWVDDVRIEKR